MNEQDKQKNETRGGIANLLSKIFRSRDNNQSTSVEEQTAVNNIINTEKFKQSKELQIKYSELDREDRMIVKAFKQDSRHNDFIVVNVNTGKLDRMNSTVYSQIEAYRIHGDKYIATADIRRLSDTIKLIVF